MELVDGIELQELVTAAHDSGSGAITERWVSLAMGQVVGAVTYCHAKTSMKRQCSIDFTEACVVRGSQQAKVPERWISEERTDRS